MRRFAVLLPALALLFAARLLAAPLKPLNIGQYDAPRDFTLRITDPYPPENPALLQPVVGYYTIKILPPNVEDVGSQDRRYLARGLYFKQVRDVIYVDVRQPPAQLRAGYHDLSVLLSLPVEGDFSSRQPRAIRYVDASTDVVLALDNSSSMEGNDPGGLRYLAAENFIRLATLSNKINRLAVIKFSATAKLTLPWTPPAKVRNIPKLLRESKPGNFTNINRSLEMAAQLFEDSPAQDKIVILLTDGRNEPDRYNDSHLALHDLGVRVITVGLSKRADRDLLKRIADETGGAFFKAVDDENLLRIYNQIASEISEFKAVAEGEVKGSAEVYATGADEILSLSIYDHERGLDFSVLDPQGRPANDSQMSGQHTPTQSLFRLVDPQPGRWTLVAKRKGAHFRYAADAQSPLLLKLFPLEKKYLQGELAHFAASLASLEIPMTGAEIQGEVVDGEKRSLQHFALYDDGVHGDNHADDGVYGIVVPVDVPEGSYTLSLHAQGKTPGGEIFTRMESSSFSVLRSAQSGQGALLASVLPLYLDLGEIEAGSTRTAHLRLSFQGRGTQRVSFKPENTLAVASTTSPAALPWSAVTLPEGGVIEAAQPVVYGVSFTIPGSAIPGAYSGSFSIALGDQFISLPVDLKVVSAKLAKKRLQALGGAPAPRDLEPLRGGDTREAQHTELAMESPPAGAGSAFPAPAPAVLAGKAGGAKAEPAPATATEPALPPPAMIFKVWPEEPQSFRIAAGQSALSEYTLVNLSSEAGTVEIQLAAGPGDLSTRFIEIPAEGKASVSWIWHPDNIPPEGRTRIEFKSGTELLTRELAWQRKFSPALLAFFLTAAGLAASTLFFGLRYLSQHQPADLHMSLSSGVHLVAVIAALTMIFRPPEIEKPEPKNVEVAMISPESIDYVEEYLPSEEKFVENGAAEPFIKDEGPGKHAPPLPAVETRPRQILDKAAAPVAVSIELTMEDSQPQRQLTPAEIRAEREAPLQTAAPPTAAGALARELSPERAAAEAGKLEASLPERHEQGPGSVAPTPAPKRSADASPEWNRGPAPGELPTVVLSVNDRPNRRAVMHRGPAPEASARALAAEDRTPGVAVEREAAIVQGSPSESAPASGSAPRQITRARTGGPMAAPAPAISEAKRSEVKAAPFKARETAGTRQIEARGRADAARSIKVGTAPQAETQREEGRPEQEQSQAPRSAPGLAAAAASPRQATQSLVAPQPAEPAAPATSRSEMALPKERLATVRLEERKNASAPGARVLALNTEAGAPQVLQQPASDAKSEVPGLRAVPLPLPAAGESALIQPSTAPSPTAMALTDKAWQLAPHEALSAGVAIVPDKSILSTVEHKAGTLAVQEVQGSLDAQEASALAPEVPKDLPERAASGPTASERRESVAPPAGTELAPGLLQRRPEPAPSRRPLPSLPVPRKEPTFEPTRLRDRE